MEQLVLVAVSFAYVSVASQTQDVVSNPFEHYIIASRESWYVFDRANVTLLDLYTSNTRMSTRMQRDQKGFEAGLGLSTDVEAVIDLSLRVQEALTASGSVQEIGPLDRTTVLTAIEERRCCVLRDASSNILGCAFIKHINEEYFAPSDDFNIAAYSRPWWYLHWIMLEPKLQGSGVGVPFFEHIVKHIEPSGGTLLLDCWAGSRKLKGFYERAGCHYVATLPENDYEIAVFLRALRKTTS